MKEDEDDDEGLEFIDPIALSKAKQAEAAANKDQNQKPAMVMINGKLVPANTVSLNMGSTAQSGVGMV